jgi:DedD protein
LKQRLIGAAVLVALAVIFLPMLVDGPEPEKSTTAVPLELPPPPDRDFETRELRMAPPSANSVATPASQPADEPASMSDNGSDVEEIAPAAESSGVVAESERVGEPAATPPATVPVVTAPAVVAAPRAPSSGNFAVNLGSYANIANARELAASLKAKGQASYTEDIMLEGKPALRVRLGPFAQRGEAEAARLAATRANPALQASVVALDNGDSNSARAPVRAPVAAGYAVQIGALKTEADASALRERARSAGFVAFVERVQTDSGALWRVRIGPELKRENADRG